MHMFFVAFCKRQRKIVECLEKPNEKTRQPGAPILNEALLSGASPERKYINVIDLDEELDLE
jgi:hypothetical protein